MTTPAMGLSQPTPSITNGIGVAPPGQSWGELYNSNFAILDTHTHAPGSGSLVPTAGISINADLTFAGFNATNLRTTRFSPIALGAIGGSDRNCLLASSGDLYFVDGAGNQVRMTSAGGVAGTPGAISGLASPAAVTYTPASKLFTFTSSTPRVAGVACGPLIIGDASVDNGFQVTISAPAGLAANYALTLPTALPGANALLSLSTTGALSAFATVAASDLTLAGALTVQGNAGIALTGTTSGNSIIKTTGAGLGLALQGNVAAAAGGADIVLGSTATRTAGFLGAFQNAGANKLFIDWQGLITLASQAAPIQPSSLYTVATPNAGWSTAVNQTVAYWKDAGGVVHLKGQPTFFSGVLAAFTLPVGFRPAFQKLFMAAGPGVASSPVVVVVNANGDVFVETTAGSPTSGYVEGVTFLAEA